MKLMKWFLVFGLAVTFLACNSGEDGEGTPAETAAGEPQYQIAVIPKGTIHEFWKSVHAGAVKAARELDVEIIWKGPLKEDDRESQVAVVENFIARGVSGMVLAPLDDTALRRPVDQAMQNGIPVVIFDSGLKGDNFVSYVATDNFKGGQIAGDHMAEILNGQGNIVVLRYAEGSDSTTQRENGFLDAISKHEGIQVISDNQYAGVTTESALQAAENLFARFRNPDGSSQIDGIFCACEPVVLGIMRAMSGAGLSGKVKLVGFDVSDKMIAALREGTLDGFVVQDPMQIGYLGVKTLVQHLNGQAVEPKIQTSATLITPENIDQPEIQKLVAPDLEQWLE